MATEHLRLGCASVILLLALASLVSAQDKPAASSEIELGEIPHYADEDAARTACQPDSVVWADQKNGFYYPKFFSDYGKTQHGPYTCYKQAKKADYWSLTPASDGGHKGREFPMFFCTACF